MKGGYSFFNREISWLDFNDRVLEEACDNANPLLERLKFTSIFFSNLDEFFMVRISALITQIRSEKVFTDPSGLNPEKIIGVLQEKIKKSTAAAYDNLNNDILKNLEYEGIVVYDSANLPVQYKDGLYELFMKKYILILTPMAVDVARPFPFIPGKTSNILFSLENHSKPETLHAIVPLPAGDPFITVNSDEEKYGFIHISEFVKMFSADLFTGYKILSSSVFRITRDAELNIDEEGAEDLLSAIREELKKRKKGTPIRLEVESGIDDGLFSFLKENIGYYGGFCYRIKGLPDPSEYMKLASLNGLAHLKDRALQPVPSRHFSGNEIMFDVISKKDVILNLPYESFDPVVRLLHEAAADDRVLAIKQTLYRTSWDSPVIDALKKAAECGKQVTVIVELKARFDEEQNITWANQLEEKGCHVIYGLAGLKTHCKILLIVRDEPEGIRRYVHLSTGNYNETTARIYTDIGLFTAMNSFGRDASAIFNALTGYSELPHWKKIVTSPADLRNFFNDKIDMEMNSVKNGGKGKIVAKLNSLVDTRMIEKLYEASNAGVEIKLLVRGMCCLVPGVKKQSENISVISIVDRFLEHSRVYYFYDSGNEEIYLSSADLMERNFDRRIEILYPVDDEENKKEMLDILEIYFSDNVKSRRLYPDGSYVKIKPKKNEKKTTSQTELYKYFSEKNKNPAKKSKAFVPQKKSRK